MNKRDKDIFFMQFSPLAIFLDREFLDSLDKFVTLINLYIELYKILISQKVNHKIF